MGDILVTGAGRGIGYCLVAVLASKGHRVYAGVRKDEGQLDKLTEKWKNITVLKMDVTKEEQVLDAAKRVKLLSGGLDAVVSNAGVCAPEERKTIVTTLRSQDLEYMLSVNVIGAARVIRKLGALVRDGGVFATITSEAGAMSNIFPEMPGYSISKAAENKLVSIQYVTEKRFRVFAIHPGRVDTDMGHVSAQITPWESAEGIAAIVTGERNVPREYGWFIDYRGERMQY